VKIHKLRVLYLVNEEITIQSHVDREATNNSFAISP